MAFGAVSIYIYISYLVSVLICFSGVSKVSQFHRDSNVHISHLKMFYSTYSFWNILAELLTLFGVAGENPGFVLCGILIFRIYPGLNISTILRGFFGGYNILNCLSHW